MSIAILLSSNVGSELKVQAVPKDPGVRNTGNPRRTIKYTQKSCGRNGRAGVGERTSRGMGDRQLTLHTEVYRSSIETRSGPAQPGKITSTRLASNSALSMGFSLKTTN